MLSKDIKRILKENEKYFKILEDFDRTGKFGLDKIRRSFTIKQMNYEKLKKLSKQKKINMSEILDNTIENM